jgi:hypothetical protein
MNIIRTFFSFSKSGDWRTVSSPLKFFYECNYDFVNMNFVKYLSMSSCSTAAFLHHITDVIN